jgi:hypothetical protein
VHDSKFEGSFPSQRRTNCENKNSETGRHKIKRVREEEEKG